MNRIFQTVSCFLCCLLTILMICGCQTSAASDNKKKSNSDLLGDTEEPAPIEQTGMTNQRKPLPPTARRHGWVGCNILYSNIPKQGKIPVIQNKIVVDKEIVIGKYTAVKEIQTNNIETRGWLFDVLNCVNNICSDTFTLKEMYGFVDILQEHHQDNHNIEAKIRQQLQLLRDKGFIEFLGGGVYRKIIYSERSKYFYFDSFKMNIISTDTEAQSKNFNGVYHKKEIHCRLFP